MSDDEPAIRLTLPVPPSTNNLYRSGPRYKTDEYKRWITESAYGVMIQTMDAPKRLLVTERLRVVIEAPFSRRRDIENIKPVMDLIASLGLIRNDNQVDDLRIVRVAVDRPLVVSVWPISA